MAWECLRRNADTGATMKRWSAAAQVAK
ncbi:hypothetical protein [Bradyrhizobium brasilense]